MGGISWQGYKGQTSYKGQTGYKAGNHGPGGKVAVVSAEPMVLTSTRDMNDKVCEGLYNPWPQKAQNMFLLVVPRWMTSQWLLWSVDPWSVICYSKPSPAGPELQRWRHGSRFPVVKLEPVKSFIFTMQHVDDSMIREPFPPNYCGFRRGRGYQQKGVYQAGRDISSIETRVIFMIFFMQLKWIWGGWKTHIRVMTSTSY